MADIELVIKIPEGLKKDFETEQWTALSCMEMKNALINGTPLPKGHGRLIDADTLEFRNVNVSYGYDWECGEITYAEEKVVRADDIWDAPTIIKGE